MFLFLFFTTTAEQSYVAYPTHWCVYGVAGDGVSILHTTAVGPTEKKQRASHMLRQTAATTASGERCCTAKQRFMSCRAPCAVLAQKRHKQKAVSADTIVALQLCYNRQRAMF